MKAPPAAETGGFAAGAAGAALDGVPVPPVAAVVVVVSTVVAGAVAPPLGVDDACDAGWCLRRWASGWCADHHFDHRVRVRLSEPADAWPLPDGAPDRTATARTRPATRPASERRPRDRRAPARLRRGAVRRARDGAR